MALRGKHFLSGNPNSGKSTVFNALTGLRQRVSNYPGVTVERRIGRGTFGGTALDLIDLPGTYSLSPTSADERIAVDVLFGRVAGTPRPEGPTPPGKVWSTEHGHWHDLP